MTVSLTTSSTACTMSASFPSSTALNDVPCALSAELRTEPVAQQHKTASATGTEALRLQRANKGNGPCLWKGQKRKSLDLQSISIRESILLRRIQTHGLLLTILRFATWAALSIRSSQ